MERLTEDSVTGETYIKHCASSCPYDGDFCGTDECPVLNAVSDKLGEYERAEEQGLLVRLPCKVGDTVWDNDFGYPKSYEIKAFSYGYCDSYVEPDIDIEDQIIFYYENYSGSIAGAFPMSEIGKTIFFTREEAVKKVGDEEMNNRPTPDITPNLAISAYHVLQQYCTGQPADCKGCGFYEHCPECFRGMPCDWNLNEEGEINEVKKGNTD